MPTRARTFVVATLLAFATFGGWLATTPLMASPDEPAHVVRAAAAAYGQITGSDSDDVAGAAEVLVPIAAAEAEDLTCMAFNPTESGACQEPLAEGDGSLVPGATTAELNLPTYYVLVGWPMLLLDGEASLWAMRLVSALLCSLCVGVAAMELRSLPRSRWAMTGLVASATPMTVWLAGAVNPNALEWAASVALLALLLALGRTDASRGVTAMRLVLTVVMAALLVSGRPVTLAWLLLVVVAGLLLADPPRLSALLRRRTTWVAVAAAGVYAGLAAWWSVAIPPRYDDYAPPAPGIGQPFADGFRLVWSDTVYYWRELVGVFGWKDTNVPEISAVGYGVVLLGIVLAAAALTRGRTRIALIGATLSMVLAPAILQGLLVTEVGYIWQGRYMVAVLGVLLVIAGVALDELPAASAAARLQAMALLVCAAASLWTFMTVVRRFTTGDDVGFAQAYLEPEWTPLLGTFGTTALVAVCLVATTLVLLRAGDAPRITTPIARANVQRPAHESLTSLPAAASDEPTSR